MAAVFTPTNKAPGVYIQEVQATGPIAGVSTSTAAFLGATMTVPIGSLDQPVLITNWTQFTNNFGSFSANPRLYLPHAVRGFFDNGGTMAYIVAVATPQAYLELPDRGNPAGSAIRVVATGPGGAGISVQVQDGPIVGAKVARSTAVAIASASATTVQLQNASDAAQFMVGDFITIVNANGTATTERAQISAIAGTQLTLATALTGTYTNTATVRIADLANGQTTLRVTSPNLPPSGTLDLVQGSTVQTVAYSSVAGNVVTLAAPGIASPGFSLASNDVLVYWARVVKSSRAPLVAASGTTVQLQNASDAAQFQVGDWITIDTAGPTATTERAQLGNVGAGQLTLTTALSGSYTNTATVRIADLVTGQTTFRIAPIAGIQVGSVINVSQGASSVNLVVNVVQGNFVTVAAPGIPPGQTFSLGGTTNVVVSTYEFTLIVTPPGTTPAATPAATPVTFASLSMDPRHSQYFMNVINNAAASPVYATLPVVPSTQAPPLNMPKVAPAAFLNPGLTSTASLNYGPALAALTRTTGVNLVCAPDAAGNTIAQQQILRHCETMKDRFAILDSGPIPPGDVPGTDQVQLQRQALDSNNPDSGPGFGALYFPRILISDPMDPTGNSTVLVPPSGHIAGLYATFDDSQGVQQVAAGTSAMIAGALGLETVINDGDQGPINEAGINALRIFAGQATAVVWGARTLAPAGQLPFRYINVRRLFIFIEQSILEGIRWAVFQPNDQSLWKKLERTITEFLTRIWRSGALVGTKVEQAFYVKIDDELNPPDQQELGIVTMEIGIAPVRPAEYVVVQIAMWDGGSSVTGG